MVNYTGIPKRKRIETLVNGSIEQRGHGDKADANGGLPIVDQVRNFIDAWPHKYFDTGDDRKIAGLVIAYMMESSQLEVEQLSPQGFQLLKLAAELDPGEFRENTPRTFDQLSQHNRLQTRPGTPGNL